jgi:hypothetical protein
MKVGLQRVYLWSGVLVLIVLVASQFISCVMDITPMWDTFSDKVRNP